MYQIQIQERGQEMDTKFSVALHLLVMISESGKNLTSQELAKSVGTNSSYIRKVIALLKSADIITSHQGKSGYQLVKAPKDLTLLEIYQATQEIAHIHLFQMHQNANLECPVGKHIEKAVKPIFFLINSQLENDLSSQTLSNVIENLYREAN